MNAMENHRRKNSSGDKFSFPIFPLVEDHGDNSSSFEFGSCPTPNSPADHLFFNGRLLPHAFPCQTTNTFSYSRSTSRTSSVGSKDSFMSSRSNSTNSRSSSCSSARTSTSEATSERKLLTHQAKVSSKTIVSSDWYRAKNKPVLTPHYGSSQRWQFITPAPPLKHQGSRTRKVHQSGEQEELKTKKQAKDWTGTWSGWRFFRSFVSACKECHAIKPSPRKYPAKN